LRGKPGRDLLMAAVGVLVDHPYPPARPKLVELLVHLSRDDGLHDPGSYARRMVLDALRRIAKPEDIAVLARAVETYEFFAPDFKEDAVLLRASALITLSALDEELARYHAVRLLSDGFAQPMSGEPALTAVRVLVALGELVALYAYAMQPDSATLPEVVSEALRQLTAVPPLLIRGIVQRHGQSRQPVVLVSLFDLLLNHEEGPQGQDYLLTLLQDPPNADLYRYLVTSMVATGNTTLLDELVESARFEQDRRKVEVLVDALGLVSGYRAVAEILPALEARIE
jgi:hypothetical protein